MEVAYMAWSLVDAAEKADLEKTEKDCEQKTEV